MKLRDYNALQADLADRLADAFDAFAEKSHAYHVAVHAASQHLTPGCAQTIQTVRAYSERQQAALALAARVQDVAGVEFRVETQRAF